MNIYQKMSAITQEISKVAKNLQVGEGKNQYKAVGEADVLAAVKPIEAKHGVYSYPFDREIVESGEMVNTTKYGDRKSLYLRVKTIYRFVNVDEPSEFIDITTYAVAVLEPHLLLTHLHTLIAVHSLTVFRLCRVIICVASC